MEAIITIVGFLGAGKTTLLRHLVTSFIEKGWDPFIILNDYENAYLDLQQFSKHLDNKSAIPLSGSCICCSGINELREFVNRIPERKNGITFIEANGTSDAYSLAGFLGVGLDERFMPPVQISVVDVKNWQRREEHNELELNQILVSTLIVLTHTEDVTNQRKEYVVNQLKKHNPTAGIFNMDELDIFLLPKLLPSNNKAGQMDHFKSHWSSSSIDLPDLPDEASIHRICQKLPNTILRVKGCTRVGTEQGFRFFERTPDGQVRIKFFYGEPTTGPKLLAIGPGSDTSILKKAVASSLNMTLDMSAEGKAK